MKRFFGELFVAVSAFFLGRVHGGAQIVPEKNRESFPLSENVFWCWLRMLLLAEYGGVLKYSQKKIARVSSCLRMFVGVGYGCFCWQSMFLPPC